MRYDAVFISDVHLGTDRCHAVKVFEVFKNKLNTKEVKLWWVIY